MLQMPDRARWAESTAAELRKAADAVAAAPAPAYLGEERLDFSTLREQAGAAIDKLTVGGRIDRDRCIYVIALADGADPEALKAAFAAAKKDRNLKLPQDNKGASSTLYVGSSCATDKRAGTLRARLR